MTSTVDFLMKIIPTTFVDAFAKGDILQVLLLAILFGVALMLIGPPAKPLVNLIELAAHAFFKIIGLIIKLAPLGVLGAIAFTVESTASDR